MLGGDVKMSKKKDNAKRLLEITAGCKSVDELDEILHPEYFGKKYFSDEDLPWMNNSSWNWVLAQKKIGQV